MLAPIVFLIVTQGCSAQASGANVAMDSPRIVGGPCEYKDYRGKAEIVSMQKMPQDKVPAQGAPSGELYEVMYRFIPETKIHEPFEAVHAREFVLLTDDGTHPDLEFIRRNGIDVGRRYDCLLKAITRGACTPLIFTFPTLK